jgi:hypothetical protein
VDLNHPSIFPVSPNCCQLFWREKNWVQIPDQSQPLLWCFFKIDKIIYPL